MSRYYEKSCQDLTAELVFFLNAHVFLDLELSLPPEIWFLLLAVLAWNSGRRFQNSA